MSRTQLPKIFPCLFLATLVFTLLIGPGGCDNLAGDIPGFLPPIEKGSLGAGFGAAEIIVPAGEEFQDLNSNGIFDGEIDNPAGVIELGIEPFSDADGDGIFEPIWLAGRGGSGGFPARNSHDPIEARAAIFKSADQIIALVALDVAGVSRHLIADFKNAVMRRHGINNVSIISTGNISAPDLTGMGYYDKYTSSVSPEFLQSVSEAIVLAIDRAAAAFVPVRMEAARIDASEAGIIDNGSAAVGFCLDDSDPVITDSRLTVFAFYPLPISDPPEVKSVATSSGPVIGEDPPDPTVGADQPDYDGLPLAAGSLIIYNCRPADFTDKFSLSGGYPAVLRSEIDFRLGGSSIVLAGASGGASTAGAKIARREGSEYIVSDDGLPIELEKSSYLRLDSMAGSLTDLILAGLGNAEIIGPVELGFAETTFVTEATEQRFLTAAGHLERPLILSPDRAPGDGRVLFESTVGILEIGGYSLLLAPGEPPPEALIGSPDDFNENRTKYFPRSGTEAADYPALAGFNNGSIILVANAGDALGFLTGAGRSAALTAGAVGNRTETLSPGPRTLLDFLAAARDLIKSR